MYRGHKNEEEKKLRRLWAEYTNSYSWKNAKEKGHWEEVTPYQKGYTRKFVLRDDIKNRNDAREIRNMLDLINYEQYSRREDFTEWNYRTKKYEPRTQKLSHITVEKYEALNEKLKSFFVYKEWIDTVKYPYPRKVERKGYFAKHDYWFVLNVEPNIITHHWIPDGEFESRREELRNKIFNGENYGKLNKVMGWSNGRERDYQWNPLWVRNKYGKNLSDEDFEL